MEMKNLISNILINWGAFFLLEKFRWLRGHRKLRSRFLFGLVNNYCFLKFRCFLKNLNLVRLVLKTMVRFFVYKK